MSSPDDRFTQWDPDDLKMRRPERDPTCGVGVHISATNKRCEVRSGEAYLVVEAMEDGTLNWSVGSLDPGMQGSPHLDRSVRISPFLLGSLLTWLEAQVKIK